MACYCKYCGHKAASVASLTAFSCRNSPNGKHILYEGGEHHATNASIADTRLQASLHSPPFHVATVQTESTNRRSKEPQIPVVVSRLRKGRRMQQQQLLRPV